MDFFCKSQRFGKSRKTFGSRIFFLSVLKSIGWYGFPYGFLAVLNLFIIVSFWFGEKSQPPPLSAQEIYRG